MWSQATGKVPVLCEQHKIIKENVKDINHDPDNSIPHPKVVFHDTYVFKKQKELIFDTEGIHIGQCTVQGRPSSILAMFWQWVPFLSMLSCVVLRRSLGTGESWHKLLGPMPWSSPTTWRQRRLERAPFRVQEGCFLDQQSCCWCCSH
ncbi:60S ribosomal protein L8 [Lemmus lemmus]